ncbi:Aste57867_8705 [Aphanomyces stellatus]|uniref:Aste57867_8705 protein n=1 Tax=Aphanomyces stellatus TaxID=120398 RepID=A0A485KL43_9STRA|nr:hypothetical protein As57867_008671 [Aphanomyces stellatus]VFT85591.1 Aste57867_8705 [Aphanomyces stellatus]
MGYATKSSTLVWLTAAIWSLVAPVQHDVSLERTCTLPDVDFQVNCMSGTLAIGRMDRFDGLLVLAAGSCVIAFLLERWVSSDMSILPVLACSTRWPSVILTNRIGASKGRTTWTERRWC